MNIIIENPFTYLVRGCTLKMAWLEGVFIVITVEESVTRSGLDNDTFQCKWCKLYLAKYFVNLSHGFHAQNLFVVAPIEEL